MPERETGRAGLQGLLKQNWWWGDLYVSPSMKSPSLFETEAVILKLPGTFPNASSLMTSGHSEARSCLLKAEIRLGQS